MDKLIDLLLGYKKIKIFYYLNTNLNLLRPEWCLRWYKKQLETKFTSDYDTFLIRERVSYYNKIDKNTDLGTNSVDIQKLSRKDYRGTYYFDSMEYLQFFNKNNSVNVLFGDVIHTPNTPTLVKSRPIENNTNSIILNLDKHRHFLFIKDKRKFSDKKDKLIGIGMVNDQKALRVRFLEMHFNNPLCDIGHTNDFRNNQWKIDFVSIHKQLQYKFILCWEGNDVATNLKYVMSSNSLAICTKPIYETWFMEGTLIGGVHYVEIKDDFSDLNEKIEYYSKNIEASEKIIANANAYVKQFQNKKREDLISLLVLEKYFTNTGQMVK
ncbi:glycosyl transferase family 90 [Flavicella marina]|uniref:glycosyl transferase family 90 n=1 Tax=Flavicella marina TaxID=1475951 RepID=UPI001264DD79|nr:glycosyl transferase family 90 [Flavicella marina]